MATKTNRSAVQFLSLSNKLSSLAYIKTENEKQVLLTVLTEFNSLNYSDLWHVANEKAVLVINQCCYLVPHDEIALKNQVLQLFLNLLQKQNVSVVGITLTVAVAWTLECIKSNREKSELPLVVFSFLIRGKSSLLDGQLETIFQLFFSLVEESISDEVPNIYYNCLTCVESLSYCGETSEIPKTIALKCSEFFLSSIKNIEKISYPFWRSKCLIVNLSAMSNIVQKSDCNIYDILPEVFGVAKSFMLFGIAGYDWKVEKVSPSNIALPEDGKKTLFKKPMAKYDKKSKKKDLTSISDIVNDDNDKSNIQYTGVNEEKYFLNKTVTSDSDFSDSEGGMSGKIRKSQTQVRRCCLNLLGNLFSKGEIKTMIRYLPSFLPDGSNLSYHLITCLLKDSSPSCRSEVLIVLSILLKKFKQFFSLADSVSKSSFTTLSNNIANIIVEIHLGLIASLRNENYKVVIIHILKTISDLIRCSPYHKLDTNILIDLGKEIAPLLNKSDVICQIAAFVAFGCITSIEPKVEHVKKVVFCDDDRCWLFDKCSAILRNPIGCNPAVAVECLQVLAAVVRNFPHETVISNPNDVYKILEMTSSNHDYLIRFYAAKFLKGVAYAVQISVDSLDESKRCSVGLAAMIWNKLIFGPIESLIQCDTQAALRSSGCDCLSFVALTNERSESEQSSLIYDQLTRSDQIACITYIFSCAKDENAQVRSSAVRCLAVFVQFSALREDPLFFLDAVDVFLKAASDSNMIVKVQAAWLLGHLAEAAVMSFKEGLDVELTDDLLIRLLKTSVKLSNDTKKGKPYTVRGIANLLVLVPDQLMKNNRQDLLECIDCLLQNASTGNFMKARWNACYALGIAFSNPAICLEAIEKAFPILFDLVKVFKNFKVRISAANTLSALPDRAAYGTFYQPTWQTLITGLDNAENISDFNEYQHRDHLIDEICAALSKLISIITVEDLTPIQDILIQSKDLVGHQYSRFKNRIVPEKGDIVQQAFSRLSELRSNQLSIERKNALKNLLCTFFDQEQ